MDKHIKIELQREYCNKKNLPMYLESDGRCPNCYHDITSDYTEKQCGNKLITRCKSCNRSLTI